MANFRNKENMISAFFKANKHNFFLFLTCVIGLALTSFMPILPSGDGDDEKEGKKKRNQLGVGTVVIDAGHGGKDPGAIGHSKVQEKDVVLDVSLKLGEYIKENFPDVEVIYTRESDKFVELHERAKIANKHQADLFISVHANVAGSKAAHGCETYVLGLHRTKANLKVAQKENSAILMEDNYKSHYENFDPKDPESYIALELMQSEYLEQSLEYAALSQNQFAERVGRKNRGVKQAGFLVLYRTTMPSVLVELGFLSNPSEEKFLNSDKGQSYMASALFRSFRKYKQRIDSVDGAGRTKQKTAEKIDETEEKDTVSQKANEEGSGTRKPMKSKGHGVTFKVQIAASSTSIPTDPENFKGLSNVDEYISDGIYKYTVGNEAEYESVQELQEEVQEQGYPGAFIIAIKNGERIDLQQALTKDNSN